MNEVHSSETVLLTGCAGFIGFHVAKRLLGQGHQVIGLDSMNEYYDVSLKKARLTQLQKHHNFQFHKIDIADRKAMDELAGVFKDVSKVIHLAAQAGVRYSLKEPFDYAHSNLTGQLVMLEICRHLPGLKHFVFASSSSVYGNNEKKPFSPEDVCEEPISFYAATKLSGEYMAKTYAHLYKIPTTCLRFLQFMAHGGVLIWRFLSLQKPSLRGELFKYSIRGNCKEITLMWMMSFQGCWQQKIQFLKNPFMLLMNAIIWAITKLLNFCVSSKCLKRRLGKRPSLRCFPINPVM